MNVPHYPEQTQAMGLHHMDYPQDPRTLEGPSVSQEPKVEPGLQEDPEESCPVCGDRVSGYHYGLLTCESCKGFFKRTVQNNKRYTCAERQSCPMDPAQRKRCPSCRFQKCLAVGMKREAVRADRMRGGRNKFGPLYRRDRQLKQQRGVYTQPNSTPYRIKLESQPTQLTPLAHDFHLLPVSNPSPAALHPDHYHLPHGPSMGQSDYPMLLDSARERALAPPAHPPYASLYHHPPFHGYPLEKRPVSFGHNPVRASPPAPVTPLPGLTHMGGTSVGTLTPTSTPSSTPTPTPTPTPSTPSTPTPGSATVPPHPPPPPPSEDFLEQLLIGEPDEGQLCARVLASLQREQASRGKHDCLNTFSIMCKMADQTLFGLVEWARNSDLFKELKVEDQMGLLQSCWSELLVLDHLCRQVAHGKDGSIYLVTGQQETEIDVKTVFTQAGATLSSLVSRTQDLVFKLRSLQLDRQDFVCLKYLVLFNPDVKSVQHREQVERTQERVNRALMEHTLRAHPGHSDKFGQLLLRLPEVRSISLQVEEYLYQRHLLGDLPCNSLLTEMLHAKHS